MKKLLPLFLAVTALLSSCSTKKRISPKNTILEIKKEKIYHGGYKYSIIRQEPTSSYKAEIIEKSDYIVIKPVKNKKLTEFTHIDTTVIEPGEVSSTHLQLIEKQFYPEAYSEIVSRDKFVYHDIKFGLQALTIPLKFRGSVGSDSINPPQAEPGVNIGFAPTWKFTKNIYRPTKNYLGKNTTQVAVAIGPHFGLGSADLKTASNAPGLQSDRKRPLFTWGAYALFGFNNLNFGFAWGKDSVIGTGAKNWVYQNKPWYGVIVSLDILKF